MKTDFYLYGKDVEVPEIPADICMRRIELLQEHLDELLDVHYSKRSNAQIHHIHKAIDFWNSMLHGEFK